MSREIKFRGMDVEGNWHIGNLAILPEDVRHLKKGHYISNEAGLPFAYQVRPETVGQYTGLKEMYEGDKLEITLNFEYRNDVVTDVIDFRYYMWGCNDWSLNELFDYEKKGELSFNVVGSIHEP
ncbi:MULTISPECIES: hypothetical protein [Paenibacillus]|uniref:YopX protein domain-containing protein n=1 Tax=Paenibacillus odorifer TaxID=189426 RepID=A0ABX3HXG9_9BACL|nr:hypothetical protein [Paenibacillus odorifer]OMD55287.1 hypothetical protein BSK51_04330 [Paenibacillus odorifer]